MEWELTIERADNGYIVTHPTELNDGTPDEAIVVFEDKMTPAGELEALVDLLWFVAEHFGHHNSKHNRHNLSIEIVEREIG